MHILRKNHKVDGSPFDFSSFVGFVWSDGSLFYFSCFVGFVWSDGSPFDYSLWNPKEPNDKYDQEDCTMRNKYTSGWNDDNCYKSKKIICKIMKGKTIQ